MCHTIVIGKKEIETPAQFEEHFGFAGIPAEFHYTIHPDACLCQIDIEETFWLHDISFEYSPTHMEYHVTP